MTPEVFDGIFALNLRAPLLLSRHAITSLRKERGVILNIGSINAFMGEPSLLVYAASKGALQTASRNLAKYPQVRSRAGLLPERRLDGHRRRARDDDAARPRRRLHRSEGKNWPLGRILKPTEIAEVALFLASEKGAPFSGQVIELEQFPTGPLAPRRRGD